MAAEKLQLENQNLKLKVENLEVKMENQNFKHAESLRILRADIKKLRRTNKTLIEEKKAIVEANDKKVEDQTKEIEKLTQDNAKLKRDLETLQTRVKGKRKVEKSQDDEIVKRKKEIVELSETEQKVLEGMEKYVISKRPATNFFSSYRDWFGYIEPLDYGTKILFEDCIFLKQRGPFSVHFTESDDFPIYEVDKEHVFPFINEGWSFKNTRCYILKNSSHLFEELKSSFTEEIDKPGFGSYFSFKISITVRCKQISRFFVFVRDSVNCKI